MRYKLLGHTGLRVSELALGGMTFGTDWGWGADESEVRRLFDAYVEAGGNFVDTANNYTDGTSERIVGHLVADERERFVVATKYTLTIRRGDPNGGGSHRKSLVQSLDQSLARLGVSYIDLLWVHFWDRYTPVEELMRSLDDVVSSGKVLYVGMSDAPAWFVARANTLAVERGWIPFSAYQGQYSLIERGVEREVLPMCRALDLAFCAWGILGSGVLSGKYKPGSEASAGRLVTQDWGGVRNESNLAIAAETAAVAEEIGATPSQVAVAWLRGRPEVVIPILGVTKHSQLMDNLGALDVRLSPEQRARLETASAIELGFPEAFLERGREFAYAGTDALIDDHRAS